MTKQVLTSNQRKLLLEALRSGATLSGAAALVGCSMSCAQTYRGFIKRGLCRCGAALDHPGECIRHNPGDFKPTPPELVAEAIRLRLDNDMASEAIAVQLKLGTGLVYKLLKGIPLKNRSQNNRYESWSPTELATLRSLWPHSPREEITNALPERSWDSIQVYASQMGVKRHPNANYTPPDSVDPFFRRLRAIRLARGLSTRSLAKVISAAHSAKHGGRGETVNAGMITGCETGNRDCSIHQLRWWAEALDLQVELGSSQIEYKDPVQPQEVIQELVSQPSKPVVVEKIHIPTPIPTPTVHKSEVVTKPPALSNPSFNYAYHPAKNKVPQHIRDVDAEQSAIEKFLAEKGVTKVPSSREMAGIDDCTPLKWDPKKRKFTRAPVDVTPKQLHASLPVY